MVLWRGWHNQHLRALSHGSYVSLLVARKVNEAVFLQALLTVIREKKWDLDDLAYQFCKVQNLADPPKSHPTSEEVKVHKAQAQAQFLADQLESFVRTCPHLRNLTSKRLSLCELSLKLRKPATCRVLTVLNLQSVAACLRSRRHHYPLS